MLGAKRTIIFCIVLITLLKSIYGGLSPQDYARLHHPYNKMLAPFEWCTLVNEVPF